MNPISLKNPQITRNLVSGKILARNTILNFIGQVIPLLVGVITIPFIVRGLGIERFGLLSLAWVVVGYFTIFDLGLGRATTKYVAEALGKGEEDQVPRLVWTAVTVQAILGIVSTIVLFGITPLLVEHILNIPLELAGEAKFTFYLLALSIPIVLVSSSFRGVLEAAQRFELVNAVKCPTSILTFLLPLIGLLLGFHLPGIIALILAARFGALLTFVVINLCIFPRLRKYSGTFTFFARLFSYGGWITVINIVGSILVYLDRFLIGSILSIAAVAYYTAPYEIVTRLWIFPISLTGTLFPAFSTLVATGERARIENVVARSLKYLLLLIGPIVFILMLFAQKILSVWLGSEFARQSTLVFQLLALGVLVNSLGHIPYALIQGAGRPDIIAKFHLFELPVYGTLAWLLISRFGITGAALAWTLRMSYAIPILYVISAKLKLITFHPFAMNGFWRSVLAVTTLGMVCLAIIRVSENFLFQLVSVALLVGVYSFSVWQYLIDDTDRSKFITIFTRN